jgi:hypothetical protein
MAYSVVQWATLVSNPCRTIWFQGVATARQSARAGYRDGCRSEGKPRGPIVTAAADWVVAAAADRGHPEEGSAK